MNAIKNLGCLGEQHRREQRPAIIDLYDPAKPRTIDYPTYHSSCDAVARGMARKGFKAGDRIGLLCSNRVEFLEIFFGAMRAGVVPVPIGTSQPNATVEWMVADSHIRCVFCEHDLRDKVPPGIEVIDIDSADQDGLTVFKDAGPFTPLSPSFDDVAFQPYTSGSTGRPKGVLLSHRAHNWVAETISKDRSFGPSDRMIIAAPLYHKHAMNSIKCVLFGGSTAILMRKFEAKSYIDAINTYSATVVSGVPTIFAMLLQQRAFLAKDGYPGVRLATMGGAPATDTLIDSVSEVFKSAEIVQIFGITEASAALFGRHPQGLPRPRHSIGWPIAGNDFMLLGGDSDSFGTLLVRGPGLMNGYHNNHTETERRMKDGWYNTGDILRRDQDGWYYFVGRSDDMFVSSGHNIYPGEVEIMLERHPDIEQAIVVPVPDPIKHRVPHAFVVKRVGSTLAEDDVKQHALKNAPPYQYPRQVFFIEHMPLNGVGKVDRKELTRRATEQAEAIVPTVS
jgi:long-chain acyl-CoA synthetase